MTISNQLPQEEPGRGPWQPRFGLGSMMLLMLVCSVMAAAGYYMVRAVGGNRGYQAVFILLTLIAPLLLAVILSNLVSFLNRRS